MGVDFKAYPEQLEFFFLANGVTDLKQKKAVLLTDLPTEMYQLAKDLMALMLREDSLMYDTIIVSPKAIIEASEICLSLQVWVWQPSE